MATNQGKEQLQQRDDSIIPFLLPIHTFSSSTISAIPLTPQTPVPLPLFKERAAFVHDTFLDQSNSFQETLQTWSPINSPFGTTQQYLPLQSEQLSTLRQQLQLEAESYQQKSIGGMESPHHRSDQLQGHQSLGQDISTLRFPELQEVNDATSRVLCVLSHLCPLLPPPPPEPTHPVDDIDGVAAVTSDVFIRAQNISSPSPPLSPVRSHSPPGPSAECNRRRRLTVDETEYLLEKFHKNEKPSTKERLVFAAHLHLHPRTVQVWFQNRRAKLKRDESLARVLYGDGEQEFEDEESEETEEREEMGNETEKKEHEDKQGGDVRNGVDKEQLTSTRSNKTKLADDDLELAIHRGSGTQTFVGFERSDAGLVDLMLDAELQPFPTPERLDDAHTNMFSGALLNGTRGIGEYCDLATLDLGFGLTYETMLGFPAHDNRSSLQSDTYMRIQKPERNAEDDDKIVSPIPSLAGMTSGSGAGSPSKFRDSYSSSADRVMPTSKCQDRRGSENNGHNIAGRTKRSQPPTRGTSDYTSTLSSHPNRSVNRPGRRLKGTSLRQSPFLLRRHNPIPRHQLALTLIPTSLHK